MFSENAKQLFFLPDTIATPSTQTCCEAHLHLLHHSHQISNILIALNGDTAGSESYVTANLRRTDQDQFKQITVWGRYIDEWSRRDLCWKLDKRLTIIDFDEIRDVVPMGQYDVGRRGADDPSYAVLGNNLPGFMSHDAG